MKLEQELKGEQEDNHMEEMTEEKELVSQPSEEILLDIPVTQRKKAALNKLKNVIHFSREMIRSDDESIEEDSGDEYNEEDEMKFPN